jgi:fermentation-respiration switch protein FrsA (DUF1100 family)
VWAQVPNGHSLLSVLPDPLDTLSKLPAVTVPLLVMHGEQDNIVPVAQGLRCYEVREHGLAGGCLYAPLHPWGAQAQSINR